MLHYQAVGDESFGDVICKMCNNESWILGNYESLERAEEIVQEIDDLYTATDVLKGTQPAVNIIAISLMKKIYKMPEE